MNFKKNSHWLYGFQLIGWAIRLHLSRWSAYRANVLIWQLTIWITIAVQVLFAVIALQIGKGVLFGHSAHELLIFLGMTLFTTGIAQCVVHGVVMHIGRCVWTGAFDYWLIQPPPILFRLFLEDMGLMGFTPHIFVGISILIWLLPIPNLIYAIIITLFAAIIEIGIVLSLSLPSIRWPKWDPNAGLWEYFDRARTSPVMQSKNSMLLAVSVGVLHYSIALEVFTGYLPFIVLPVMAIGVNLLAWCILHSVVQSYSSASS